MRRRFLVWFYTRIELLLTQGFRHFRNLAFVAARKDVESLPLGSGLSTSIDLGGDIGIVITTFEPRFEIYAIPLIRSLRTVVTCPIFLVVNGNYTGPASAGSIRNLLRQIAEFDDVFPIIFSQMQGCSALWNSGLAHSNKPINFVFNDDITIDEKNVASQMQLAVDRMQNTDLLTINNSWSHYLISSECLEEIGPFDERFLGFGEEDGDYIRRVVEKTGRGPDNILLPSFVNIIDQSRDKSVAVSWGKYSLLNKCLFHLKYPETQIDSSFKFEPNTPSVPKKVDSESIQKFKREFYCLLESNNPTEIIEGLTRFYK